MHLLPLVGVIHSDIKLTANKMWSETSQQVPSQVSTCLKVTCILQKMNNIIVLALFLSLTEY